MPTESDSQRSGYSTQAAGAEETRPASFRLGRRPRMGRSPIILLIIGAGLTLISMQVPDSFAEEHLIEPLLELVGVCFVAGSALVVIRRLGDIPKARSMVVAAACLAILSQTLTVFEQIHYLDGMPVLGNGGFLHEAVENGSFPLAVVLLLAGFFFAALEAQTAKSDLAIQRPELSKELAKRRSAEGALRESEEKYRHLFEQLNDAAMVADTQTGILLDANEQAEALLGRTRDEIIGMHHSELHDPDKSEYYREMFAAHVLKGHATEFDGDVVRKDGSLVPVMISAATLTLGGKRLIVGLFRDITERKRAEDALRESERTARALLNAPTDRVALMDRGGVFLALNKQMAESLGASVDELIGMCAWDLIPSDLAASRKERLQEVFNSGEPVRGQDTREGAVFDNICYPVLDSEGNVTAAAVFAKDITDLRRAEDALRQSRDELEKQVEERTAALMRSNQELLAEIAERKRVEEALRESEEKYRLLIDNAGYPITLIDRDGVVLFVNPEGARNLGGADSDFVGKSVYDLLPEMADILIERLPLIVKSGVGGVFEDKIELSSGIHWFLSNVQPVKDARGETRATLIISHDITERKLVQQSLRESEERYRTLIETSPDAITLADVDGTIIVTNRRAALMHGFESVEKMLADMGNVFDYMSQEDRQRAIEDGQRVLEEGSLRDLEYKVRRKDGTCFPAEVSASVIADADGKPRAFLMVVRDVTERKRAEEQIKASLAEKELLLKEIQHRVKNNLQVISSLLDLQSRYTDDYQVLNMLKENRNRLKSIALIHEKLYQARDLTRIDFAEYVQSLAVHLFRSYGVGSDAVKLKTSLDSLTLSVDTAIPCALIVNELVSNCLKHAFPVGRRGEIRIELRSDDGECAVVVSDNGVGLPEALDFENPPSLGLRLIRTLTDQLKGAIDLDRNGGTTFRIRFRVSQ